MDNIYKDITDLFDEQHICPLCFTSIKKAEFRFSVMQIGWGVDVVKCNKCGLVYKKYLPNEELLRIIYSKEYIHFTEPASTQENFIPSSRLMRLGTPKGRLLDYGCGAGGFVVEARNAGWEAYGCDPYLPSSLNEGLFEPIFFDYDATDCKIHELGKFDIVSMWAVVEHFKEIQKVFLSLSSILVKGGKLIFNSPYGDSLIASKQGSQWAMAILVEHLHFHTFQSARFLADLCKLELESIRVCGSPYPFGKTDTMNQGVPTWIMKAGSNMVDPVQHQPAKLSQHLCSWLLGSINLKNDDAWVSNLIRMITNSAGIGDHIEVIYRKL